MHNSEQDLADLIQFNSIQFSKSDLGRNGEQGCTIVNSS